MLYAVTLFLGIAFLELMVLSTMTPGVWVGALAALGIAGLTVASVMLVSAPSR
jgi:hypothetical protein